MVDSELAQPDRQLLDAVARLAGVDRVLFMDETLQGESRSTFAVTAGGDELVVKLVQGAQGTIDNQRRTSRRISLSDQGSAGFTRSNGPISPLS